MIHIYDIGPNIRVSQHDTLRSAGCPASIDQSQDRFPINLPEVMIAHAKERFDQEGNLTDVITKEFILALLQNLVDWTRRIGTMPPQSRVKDV